MIDFKPIATTDKELLTSFILPSDEQDCDFSFANLCSWHFMTESSYALIEDHLVIRFVTSEGNHEYFMPLGEGSPIPVIEALEACALSENEPLCLREYNRRYKINWSNTSPLYSNIRATGIISIIFTVVRIWPN